MYSDASLCVVDRGAAALWPAKHWATDASHVCGVVVSLTCTGIPIVFDFHHWKFCTGQQTQEEAFRTALTTWPAGGCK